MSANKSPTGKNVARHASAMERASRAYALRQVGMTWDEVAREVGYFDRATAWRAVTNQYGVAPEPDRGLLKDRWRQRLEKLYGDAERHSEENPAGTTAAVRVAHEAGLLDGLHEPTKSVRGTVSLDAQAQEVLGSMFTEADDAAPEGTNGSDVLDQ